jgi:hypothetical protein
MQAWPGRTAGGQQRERATDGATALTNRPTSWSRRARARNSFPARATVLAFWSGHRRHGSPSGRGSGAWPARSGSQRATGCCRGERFMEFVNAIQGATAEKTATARGHSCGRTQLPPHRAWTLQTPVRIRSAAQGAGRPDRKSLRPPTAVRRATSRACGHQNGARRANRSQASRVRPDQAFWGVGDGAGKERRGAHPCAAAARKRDQELPYSA